ncbi:MAG: tetratricopeptide repeat protein [Acidobacteriales bacterium]|nr:tetratricopeptide repeat protein [Terriglobales bacterium]
MAVTQYDRTDVLRILRITNRQMQGWERAGLFPMQASFSFFDLLSLKALRDLRAKRVRSAVILKSLEEMKLASGMTNPLLEASVVPAGRRVAFRHHGKAVEPVSGQYVFDFVARGNRLLVVDSPMRQPDPDTVVELFARGVALEDDIATQTEAIAAYEKVLELEPQHAAAFINLGTIYYNRQEFGRAEAHYRKAIEAEPRYALAYFDLGNVLDETGRLPEAIRAYQTAIMLTPTYADAHYNVALAFEKLKLPRKALSHWQAYIKLDQNGPWFNHAKQQIKKILSEDGLKIVARGV